VLFSTGAARSTVHLRVSRSIVRKLGLIATVVMTLMLAAGTSSASSSPSSASVAPRANARQAQDVDGVYFLSPRVGWTSADGSTRLIMTTDGGARWRDVSPPMLTRKGLGLASGLAGADFLSPSDFFVSAYDIGTDELLPVFLLHTTDAGRKWTEVGSFPNGVGEAWVSFLNDRQGWVAIGNGAAGGTSTVTIYATTAAGAHWVMVARSPSLSGRPGTPDNPGGCGDTGLTWSGSLRAPVLWLTGFGSVAPCVRVSTDGGRRWGRAEVLDPSAGSGGEAWPPVFSSESDGALAVWYGTPGEVVTAVYSTTNGGASWMEHRTPLPKPGLVDVVSSRTWFAATGMTIYHTTNGGVRWSGAHVSLNFSNSQPQNALDFVNAVDGWAVLSGALWHTTDGGRLWVLEPLP
jgi:photosystem II stability/assembly factor-like uncharacterized protein